jgi:site-specific DNA-methyltransferase (adenine-specific)
MSIQEKKRAARNKTLTLVESEKQVYGSSCIQINKPVTLEKILNKTISQDLFSLLDNLPAESFDLIFADPPYNLTKTFNGRTFRWKTLKDYEDYLETWIPAMVRLLKPQGSMYICGDWRSSSAIHRVAEKYLEIQNRITWEREKGRGALSNWKNSSEDIWFCTKSDDYFFNVEAVKLKRKVVAPYKQDGKPKDWQETEEGNFRLTHPICGQTSVCRFGLCQKTLTTLPRNPKSSLPKLS